MARKVQQVRYYGEGQATLNQPSNVTGQKMRSGSVFAEYTPMLQLGIQAMPGTKFYLNGSADPIIIGSTGIYELSVENLTEITGLNFDITSINMVNNSPSTSYIIVDILYED